MNESVLLVDDDKSLLDGLSRVLKRESYQVLCSSSAEEALELMQGLAVNVIISDQEMPGIKGVDFLGIVRKRYPDCVRMLLTGKADLDTAMRAINEGEIYRFFSKPCSHLDLALAIRDALRQGQLIAQARRLLDVMQMQSNYIEQLEKEVPGISKLNKNANGAIVIEDSDSLEQVIEQINAELELAEIRLKGKKIQH